MDREESLCCAILAQLASCGQSFIIARIKTAREEEHAIKIRTEQQQSFAFSQREVEVGFKLTWTRPRVVNQSIWEPGVCQ